MLTIIIIYLTVMVAIGIYLSNRVKQASDFLIAGRKLGLILTTATLAAVQVGAGVILGGSEMAAEIGIWPGMWYGIGCGGGLILAGLLVAGKLRKRGGIVPLDFFAHRYGEKKWVRVWGLISNIPSLLGIFVAQIMAAGSIFKLFGLSYTQGVLISGIVIMLYSVMSGMWGVVVTDFFQIGIIIVGIPLVAVMIMLKLGGSHEITVDSLLLTKFIPKGLSSKAIFTILPFLLSISVSYDAFMRFQSAKSEEVAKWGAILGGILVIFISFCASFVGAAGKALNPALENGVVFSEVTKNMLSPVIGGLVVAALLAAAMSSANCLLISLSGCFSRDLYNKVFHPSAELNELKYAKMLSRTVIVLALIIGVGIAFQAKGIINTIIIFNYPYMGSMIVPLLGGVLWQGATVRGAVAAMVTGGIIGVASFFAGIPGKLYGLFNIDLGLLMAYGASTVVFILVSIYTSPYNRKLI